MLNSKSKLILVLSLIILSLVIQNCRNEDDETDVNPTSLEQISLLTATDIGDNGNGTDLQVSFSKVVDESFVKNYRIFVVNSAESANFNLTIASSISADNYFTVDKTGINISTTLSENSKTVSGELIQNEQAYTIFVMSTSEDVTVKLDALSAASAEITLIDSSNPIALDQVSNIILSDVGDNNNGSDLQCSFSKVPDESNVKEYKIFVVDASESSTFNQSQAEMVASDNFFVAPKTGNDISITLQEDSKTISGDLISNDVPYEVFVMTVSEDPLSFSNSLSAPSQEFTLTMEEMEEKVKVTFIANDGVMIEFEDKKVVIDAINVAGNLGGWVSPSAAELLAVTNGTPPFDDIDVIMITHNHGDHYATSAVQTYLMNHPDTKLIVPDTMKPIFAAYSSRIPDYTLSKFERINLNVNGISIDILEIEHFDQFGNDFSEDEAFAYSVHFNNKRFLHTGDIDYIDSQLDVFDLLSDDISVAFIPTFGNLVNAANRDALIENVNPDNIVCLHFLTSSMATTLSQINIIYPDAETFTVPFETLEY